MSVLCFIQGHSPSEEQIWNRGFSFSKCRRCRCDMVRSAADWQVVPRGHKVVWKAGLHEHSRRAGSSRNLPILYRDAVRRGLPDSWRGGWYRQVLALAGGGVAQRSAAPAAAATAIALDDPESDGKPFPYAIALAAIAGAGLQLLFAERIRRGL